MTHAEWSYTPPLPDELLLEGNFFELYPLDGGGALVTPEMVSSIQDGEFARQILEEDALRDFGQLPRLDYRRFERWRTVQKSCWINRFYWVVPLAKRFALTHDRDLARLIVASMLHFIETCPAPADKAAALKHMKEVYHRRDNVYNQSSAEEIQRDETDIEYVWFDFEPASRLIHWLYAIHFLQMGDGIKPAEWEKLAASLRRHAEVIFYGEHFQRPLRARDNHQSLRGIALLHAGAFFGAAGPGKEFLAEGIRIINFHSRESYFPDGSLMEVSPSYHVFQTWHMRDACLLSKQYGFALDPEVTARLGRHADYIRAVTDGGDRTVVLEDGYPVPTSQFLASIEASNGTPQAGERMLFPDAGISVFRKEGIFLLFDASPFTGRASHYHAGKNAFTLWVKGKPFFVDSGCCSYDNELYSTWYRTGQAHSSLLVDGQADGQLRAFCDFATHATPQLAPWSHAADGADTTSSALTSTTPAWEGVVWTRTMRVGVEKRIEICDCVRSRRQVQLSFIFNLHPDALLDAAGHCAVIRNGGVQLNVTWQSSAPLSVETNRGCAFLDFEQRESRQARVELAGQGVVELSTVITWN